MTYKATLIGSIPCDWELFTVEKLIKKNIIDQPLDGNHGSKHPKQKDFGIRGIPFITATDITADGKLNLEECKLLREDKAKMLTKGFAKNGDVLLTHKGTVGRTTILNNIKFDFIILSPQVTYYRVLDKNKLNNVYLKYYFDNNNFKLLLESWAGSGSTRLYLGIVAQKKLPIVIPSIKEQDKIASILSSLDEKVELNNQINKNLEELAQAIFKQWFVDYEFPDENEEPYKSSGGEMVESELGKIPKGWEVLSLTKVADFLNGLAMQKYPPENIENSDLCLPVLKIKELKNGKTTNESDKCSVRIEPKYIVNNGDIIFSWSGSLEVKIWCGDKAGLNQHLFKVTSESYPKWFYYFWVKYHIEEFRKIAKDKTTTMGHIRRQDLNNTKVLDPGNDFLDKYGKIINDLFKLYITNEEETKRLSRLRDILLPKLISGEIRTV